MLWYCCIIGVADMLQGRLAMPEPGCKGRGRLKSPFTFSICDSILFWQRGEDRPTLACRFPEKSEGYSSRASRQLGPANSLFFDYAYTVRSGVSPDSFPTVWKPRGRDLLSSKNIWH